MGQYNMLHLCSRSSKRNSPLLGRFANMLGAEEWWDREHHSWTVKFPEDLKRKLMSYIAELAEDGKVSTQGIVRGKWGEEALKDCKLYDDLENRLGVEFQEGIIIWHIATELFLLHKSGKKAKAVPMEDEALCASEEEVMLLSNYLMFLLVERPNMLPGLAQSRLYRRTCENLVDIWREKEDERPAPNCSNLLRLCDDPDSHSSRRERKELADRVVRGLDDKPRNYTKVPRISYAVHVAAVLAANDENAKRKYSSMQVLFFMWRDFLVYAANRCSRESHAKKLSSGGELTTILWLLTEHLHQLVKPNLPWAEAPEEGT